MNDKPDKSEDSGQDAATMVALLAAVGSSEQHTQRSLAVRLDVALGLANALLRRCVSKGLIKIHNAPARRYAYYLTPKGFAEKGRLVAEYLESSLTFFRRARTQYEEAFVALAAKGVKRIAIAGSGELAEIALLSASAAGLSVIAVIAPGRNADFHGRPALRDLDAALAQGAEAVVIADSAKPQALYDQMQPRLATDLLVVPRLLHVTTTKPVEAADEERAA